jgi:hypothetical protein
MAYKSSSEYFEDIRSFIEQLERGGKLGASKRMKECFAYINGSKDEWKMFYKKLVFMKDEYCFKFTNDENNRMDAIIEAAKRVVFMI